MKKTILISVMLLFVAALGFNLANASTDQPHGYINPGHGGHSSDDRNVPIYPYAQGDTMGFWESNSNMYKCFALREILWKKGYKVTVSRETNTEDDDLALSTIVRLCNNSGADVFYSIHSNATGQGEGARVNFPMGFFRGYTDQPENPQCRCSPKNWLHSSSATNVQFGAALITKCGATGISNHHGALKATACFVATRPTQCSMKARSTTFIPKLPA